MLITLSGVIGSGKSSLTGILSKELNTNAFYEPVQDNPVLPLFYKGNEIAEQKRKQGQKDATNPYTYLLQTYFLNQRFHMIKHAMQNDNDILDRSIYEDKIFMKMNTDLGNATEIEWKIYQDLLDNMMEELPYAAHKKSPDLMIFIKVSYKTMINHIKIRGRDYEQVEQDKGLVQYYHRLLAYYQDWISHYDISPLLIIDGDKYDFVNDIYSRHVVLEQIEEKLYSLNKISRTEYNQFISKHQKEELQMQNGKLHVI